MSKIKEKTTAIDFRKNFETSSDLEIIINKQNKAISDTDYIGTGCEVQIREKSTKTVLQEYECMLYGDVDFDGEITSVDLLKIQRYILGLERFNHLSLIAGNTFKDNEEPSSADLLKIQRHILGITKIEQ